MKFMIEYCNTSQNMNVYYSWPFPVCPAHVKNLLHFGPSMVSSSSKWDRGLEEDQMEETEDSAKRIQDPPK